MTRATPSFRSRLLTANYSATPHIPISSIESHQIPSVVFPGFITPGPALLTSPVLFRPRSSSVVFVVVTPLRPTGHYSPISLLFCSSPSLATGGPGDSNNTFYPSQQAPPLPFGTVAPTKCFMEALFHRLQRAMSMFRITLYAPSIRPSPQWKAKKFSKVHGGFNLTFFLFFIFYFLLFCVVEVEEQPYPIQVEKTLIEYHCIF